MSDAADLYAELLPLLDSPSSSPAREREVKANGRVWSFCPSHADGSKHGRRSMSLHPTYGLTCFAGCAFRDIVVALRTRSGAHPMRAEPTGRPTSAGRRSRSRALGRAVATWEYTDEHGRPLLRVVRLEGPGGKTFLQQHPTSSGDCCRAEPPTCTLAGDGWRWGRGGARFVLYRLPDLQAADANAHVFVAEGEKCVAALVSRGLVATTNAGGAGKWRAEYVDQLRGRRVVSLPDNDPPGAAHTEDVARSILAVAAEVRIIVLPGLPFKGDVADWFAAGGTAGALLRLADAAPVLRPPSEMFPKAVDTRVLETAVVMT